MEQEGEGPNHDNWTKCKYCEKSFPSAWRAGRHEKICKEQFMCKKCNMKFCRKWTLDRHTKNKCQDNGKLYTSSMTIIYVLF